jgi:hypothetical protein
MRRALGLVLLFVSCAHAPVPPPVVVEAPKPVVVVAPWYGDLHALAAEAAKVRGLTLTQAFEVVPLEDDAFYAAVARTEKGEAPLQHQLDQTLSEFLGVDVEKLRVAMTEAAQRTALAALVAFYDFDSHRLFVRTHSALAKRDERARFLALAHEVGHVLQDQLNVMRYPPASVDEAIALKAVTEGDASLTAILLDAQRAGVPPGRAVERVRLGHSGWSSVELSPRGSGSSLLARELMLFPYVRGERFVADLYQAGGLALETTALLHPPTRSAALFAPQRWLGGSAAPLMPLGDPPRRLGALVMRTLLQQCAGRTKMPKKALRWFESHYLDDSFRRVGNTLSWAVAWDLEAAPELGEDDDAPSDNASIAPKLSAGLLKCLGVAADDLEVASSNGVVGLVAGAPGADRARLARAVSHLGLQERTAPRPFVIPEPRIEAAYRVAGPGVLSGDTWVHAQLGLSLNFSGGRVLDTPEAAATVMADGAALFLRFVDEPPSRTGDDRFVREIMSSWLHDSDVAAETGPHVWSKAPLTWTDGLQTRGEYEGPTAVHALVLPLCQGKASIKVIALGMSPSGQKRAEAWLESLRGSANPPICSEP